MAMYDDDAWLAGLDGEKLCELDRSMDSGTTTATRTAIAGVSQATNGVVARESSMVSVAGCGARVRDEEHFEIIDLGDSDGLEGDNPEAERCCTPLASYHPSLESKIKSPERLTSDPSLLGPHLRGLDSDQLAAVRASWENPLIIVAGAGSGKTRTLVCRLLHLLQSADRLATSVTCVTFTRNAAEELRSRVGEAIGAEVASRLLMCTYHSFAWRICRMFLSQLRPEFTDKFTVLMGTSANKAMAAALDSAGFRMKFITEAALNSPPPTNPKGYQKWEERVINAAGKKLLTIWNRIRLQGQPAGSTLNQYQAAFDCYTKLMVSGNCLDFIEMIRYAITILETNEHAKIYAARRCQYMLVDEFQDTSMLQFILLSRILDCQQGVRKEVVVAARPVLSSSLPRAQPASEYRPRVTIVGDDWQSIYGFQGGDPLLFAHCREKWSGVETKVLNSNYRSTHVVVAASNAVMKLTQQPSITAREQVSKVPGSMLPVAPVLLEAATPECEAQFILLQLKNLLEKEKGLHLGECAILARTNKLVLQMAQCLKQMGIPYVRKGGDVWKLSEVRQIIRVLRSMLNDPADELLRESFSAFGFSLSDSFETNTAALPSDPAVEGESSMLDKLRYFVSIQKAEGGGAGTKRSGSTSAASNAKRARTSSDSASAAEKAGGATLDSEDIKSVTKYLHALRVLRERLPELSLPDILKRAMSHVPWLKKHIDVNDATLERELMEFGDDMDEEYGAPPALAIGGAFGVQNVNIAALSQASIAKLAAAKESDKAQTLCEKILEEAAAFAEAAEHGTVTMSQPRTGERLRGGDRLQAFVDYLEDVAEDSGVRQGNARGVWIGTVHGAKGLEWRAVFVQRVNEGVLPCCGIYGGCQCPRPSPARAGAGVPPPPRPPVPANLLCYNCKALEEERRILYVAMSRAKQFLYVSYCMENDGKAAVCSRFIQSVPQADVFNKLYMYNTKDGPTPTPPPKAARSTSSASAGTPPRSMSGLPGRSASMGGAAAVGRTYSGMH